MMISFQKIKSLIPRSVKPILRLPFCLIKPIWTRREVTNVFRRADKYTQRIICFVTCEHGNIGDHAIVHAGNIFLDHFFEHHFRVDISNRMWNYAKDIIKKHIRSSDKLLIHGGGYFGTLWFRNEEICREIITAFPHNRIVCLPQTIFFEDTAWGAKEILNTQSVWEVHKQLFVCAREQRSYEFCKEHFTTPCYLIPDIVLYMKEQDDNRRRNGVLLCFRSDKEKTTDVMALDHIRAQLGKKNIEIFVTDTVMPYSISFGMREMEIKKKIYQFSSARLVITDRLHGMLFAVITGTPCVALNNLSYKVEGVYQWIRGTDYIKFADNIDKALSVAEEFLNADLKPVWDNAFLMTYYEKLANIIRGSL